MTKKQDNETQQDKEIQAKKDAKAAEKTSPYGAIPKPGSLDPGKTTMANPPPAAERTDRADRADRRPDGDAFGGAAAEPALAPRRRLRRRT